MTRRSVVPALVAILLAAAGCVGEADPASSTQPSTAPENALVQGSVTDDAALPVGAASVGLLAPGTNRTTTTAADGSFRFPDVAPGTYQLVASKVGFRSASVNLLVGAGDLLDAPPLILVALPPPEESWHEVAFQEGFIACHVNIGFWTLVVNQVCETDPNHDPLYEFDVSADQGFVALVLELDWTPTSAATGARLRQELWLNPLCDATHCDADRRFGHAQGPPPLKRVWGSLAEPFEEDINTAGPTHLGSFVLAPNDADYTGTGFVLQQPFTHYVTAFYNDEPDEGYSAIGSV